MRCIAQRVHLSRLRGEVGERSEPGGGLHWPQAHRIPRLARDPPPQAGEGERGRIVASPQFPDNCRSFAPFSGARLITDAQPTSLALARNALLSAALNSIGWMPALACLSRSDLISASFSLSSAFEPERRVAQHLPLRVGQALPGVEIDQHVDLDAVERRLHAELGHLLPAEIEDAGDRPAVAVDHAALERGIDLARRGGAPWCRPAPRRCPCRPA